jgi:uncharacterized protein YjbI with pentapeptide repeats
VVIAKLTLRWGLVRFSDMPGSNKWYIRRGGDVKGPYPAGLVSRYILLGRVKESDEVSSNGTDWLVVANVPDLIPQILKGDNSDPVVLERIQAARRWADERSRDRRAGKQGQAAIQENRQGNDRREMEQFPVVEHRLRRASRDQEFLRDAQGRWTILIVAGTVAVAAGIFFLFYQPPPPQSGPDCQSPAVPDVNWSNCVLDGVRLEGRDLSRGKLYSASLTGASLRKSRLRGSDLSYAALSIADLQGADLREANLTGANLRQAKLGNARLDNADLSYANLTGADLTGASLANAKLGNAIWTDGRRCLPRSVTDCQTDQ